MIGKVKPAIDVVCKKKLDLIQKSMRGLPCKKVSATRATKSHFTKMSVEFFHSDIVLHSVVHHVTSINIAARGTIKDPI